MRTVREAIGKDISLMLDMNASYDVEGCIEFARRVEPLDIYWLEEPLHWYLQPADFVRLAESFGIAGHRLTTGDALRRTLEQCLAKKEPALIEIPCGEMPSPWGFIDMPKVR